MVRAPSVHRMVATERLPQGSLRDGAERAVLEGRFPNALALDSLSAAIEKEEFFWYLMSILALLHQPEHMTNFFDLTLSELEQQLEQMNVKPYRARQVYKWVYQSGIVDFDLMTNLPKSLRATLKDLFALTVPAIEESTSSEDGSTKYVLTTYDGHSIETVFMPDNGKSTLCLSTQVGCKMSCAFCVTGKIGFIRDLTPGEIVGQVMAARPHMGSDRITNVVLMGMGEPVDNIESVLKAIEIMEEPFGLKISHRRLTISTVGLIDGLRLVDPKKAQLAISLNAATSAVRTRLMPINRVYPLQDLIAYVKSLGNMGRRRVTFEYVMLKGVNDSLNDARLLAELLKGVRCKINIIPYNESPYAEFKSPDDESVKRFQSYLIDRRFTAIIRDSRARDIGGGCGQLGMRYLEGRKK